MSLHQLYDLANAKLGALLSAVWNYPLPWLWIIFGVAAIAIVAAVIERIFFRPLP